MSDKQLTFFEFHFHDGFQLGPRSLGDADELGESTDGSTTDASTAKPVEESSDDAGPGVLGPLLGLGALAGLAYAVRKLLAGVETEGLDALDDIEEGEDATEELEPDEESVPIEITSPEDEEGGGLAPLLAGAAVLLLLFALAAKKLLSGSEEIVVED